MSSEEGIELNINPMGNRLYSHYDLTCVEDLVSVGINVMTQPLFLHVVIDFKIVKNVLFILIYLSLSYSLSC